jgi:hypothetical protein
MIAPRPDVVYYTHFELFGDLENKGHATVAMVFEDNCSVKWSVAWCAPKDKFDKSFGKMLANDRLKIPESEKVSSRITNFCPSRSESYYNIALYLLQIEMLKNDCPSWAKHRTHREIF